MNTTINLRIKLEIKDDLEEMASLNNQTLSEYLREVINDHVALKSYDEEYDDSWEESEYQENEIHEPTSLGIIIKSRDYEKTYGFTSLLTWLFCKQMDPIDLNSKVVIQSLKVKVESVINESSFSQELKMEFVKVLNDINRFMAEPDYQNKQFLFSSINNQFSFNYYRLMNEVWAKEREIYEE